MADSGKVTIHGKEYETVASRVQKFRDKYPEYTLATEVVSVDESTVIMKASILKEDLLIATGHAEENRQSSTINKTSALENCETSAIGRALAAFGLAGTEFASADEVAQAIVKQGTLGTSGSTFDKPLVGMATVKQRETIRTNLEFMGIIEVDDQKNYLMDNYGVNLPLSKQDASMIIDDLFEMAKDAKKRSREAVEV